MRAGPFSWYACIVLATTGCGAEEATSFGRARGTATGVVISADSYAEAPATAAPPAYAAAAPAPGRAAPAPSGGEAVPPAKQRKIIYNASVDLVVESMEGVEAEIRRLIQEHGGYLADTNLSGNPHAQRTGMWKVRVPSDHFDAFLAAVGKLGEMQQNRVNSEDVTMEFYDLEARISNKQQEEKRLLKHLDESTGKLEEILAVERELSRVRGEVEQMQGRLRYLANQTALSTVTITATELKDYKPPVSPTFSTQIGRTFAESVARLADFGKAVVLFVVAVAPWLPVLLLLLVPLWWLARKVWAARHTRIA